MHGGRESTRADRIVKRCLRTRSNKLHGVALLSDRDDEKVALVDAAELDTKVRLAVMINRLVAAQRLNQVTAAARLKVSQPKISALKNYRLDGLSVERLLNFLLALGQDVEIHVRPRRDRRAGVQCR